MHRGFKIAGIIAGSVFVLLVVLALGVTMVLYMHDHEKRDFIAHRLSMFQAPQGCKEEPGRSYQNESIDTASTWYLSYTCHTTGGQAYDQITTSLTRHNFVSHGDFSRGDPIEGMPAKSITYDFTYWGDGVMAEYKFLPDTVESVNDKAALQNSQVTSIGLSVSKL